jgi:hypothetical protein
LASNLLPSVKVICVRTVQLPSLVLKSMLKVSPGSMRLLIQLLLQSRAKLEDGVIRLVLDQEFPVIVGGRGVSDQHGGGQQRAAAGQDQAC